MEWQASAGLAALQARARLLRQARAFMDARGIMEVETPALSQAGNTDPAIDSLSVVLPRERRYLHTSPEYPMKRLLAGGSGDIYQIGKVWRQDESGSRHNPEFTLLEYYRVGYSYHKLMQEVSELLALLIPALSAAPVFREYRQCFLDTLGLDPFSTATDTSVLAACAATHGLALQGGQDRLDRQGWLDLLFSHRIEPGFPDKSLTFVYHYPAAQSALACVTEHEGHAVACRFEVYLGSMELGNGYQELPDGAANTRKLNQDAMQRSREGRPSPAIDRRFLAAMTSGLPHCAGVAIGLDRVLLCRLGEKRLERVISFAWELA
ncbi:MAG TPA: EF-P lysine aminoacylase EpmA [Thiolinea sp.]|nr:EF-P lysine aminoacylase EpmA [Thiolinea sp.]